MKAKLEKGKGFASPDKDGFLKPTRDDLKVKSKIKGRRNRRGR